MATFPRVISKARDLSKFAQIGGFSFSSVGSAANFLRPVRISTTDEPLRAEILSGDSLSEYARVLAEQHRTTHSRRGSRELYRRFEENKAVLEQSNHALSQAGKQNETLTSGAEWLLDNYYIIQEQIRDIRRDLPRGYYRSLPKLTTGEYAGYPRVYHIALEIVTHTDGVIDSGLMSRFIDAYQSRTALSIGELWAVPIMLRIALIENLRRLAIRNVAETGQRKVAEGLVQEIIGVESHSGTDILLILAREVGSNPELLNASAVNLMRRLREQGPKAALTLRWLEDRLKEQGKDPEELARHEQHAQAANQISIGNSITSLRRVRSMNCPEWIEGVSEIHRILLTDPSGAYKDCDFQTRDWYRHRIESLARTLKGAESEVALAAVELAQTALNSEQLAATDSKHKPDRRTSHVGYYLVSKGTRQLEQRLGLRLGVRDTLIQHLKKHSFAIYSGAIVLLTLALTLEAVNYVYRFGGGTGQALLVALLFIIPFSDIANGLVQWIAANVVRPTALPKLELEHGVPDRLRTVVTVQGIFSNRESVAEFVSGLEVRFLANDDPNIYFALLADLHDAPEQSLATDQEIVNYAVALIGDLQRRHSQGRSSPPFFLLFRDRVWNKSEGVFMGWERKRGKIEEFNRLVLGDNVTTFHILIGELNLLRSMKYVITLDSDSSLPRDVARKLIGTIAHPLNLPVLDPSSNIVIEGYGIIQPRVGVSLPSSRASNFARLFASHAGLDPYTQMVSDVYQDLFGEGSYVGKAIYDIEAFHRSLLNRVPENTLLSHDLFEGCFARVGLASDIEIFDDFPARHDVHAKRLHRWVRGDWQLLPWMLNRIPDSSGGRYVTPLSSLARWKFVDNLRRSLVAPASFACILFACTVLAGSPSVWLGLILLSVSFPVFGNLASATILPSRKISLGSYSRMIRRDLIKPTGQAMVSLSLLPYQAYLMISAILTALYRMLVSKKHLLEWQVHSFVNSAAGQDRRLPVYLLSGILLTLFAATIVAFAAPQRALYAAPFVILWVASPFLIGWLSRLRIQTKAQIPVAERDYLLSVGWDTWRYFDRFLNSENNYLIPDNLQIVPLRVVAERTSPTNVSLSVLSVISAYDLGFLDLTATVARLKAIFQTLGRLERFHGHFLNWYQIRTLEPLVPRYISFVDSGNLVGHLVAARSAFTEFKSAPIVTDRHWDHLYQRLQNLETTLLSHESVLPRVTENLGKVLAQRPSSITAIHSAIEQFASFVAAVRAAGSSDDKLRQSSVVGLNNTELESFVLELESYIALRPLYEWYPAYQESRSLIKSIQTSSENKDDDILIHAVSQIDQRISDGVPSLTWLGQIFDDLTVILGVVGSQDRSPEVLTASESLHKLHSAVQNGLAAYNAIYHDCNELIEAASAIIDEVELEFLYDKEQGLFSIGFHIDSGTRDNSFYDLLASESRLGSFIAVATGQVPQKHWFSLDRTLINSPGGTALVSWSATMFEYLMPLLVMRDYPRTLLSESYNSVVRAQRLYALDRGVPWGVSESAYSAVDFEKTYQYKAFGIPSLGLKRGLAEDFVVSPYSSFLALMVDMREALRNLRLLERNGMRGEFGFFEAVDYTPERLSSDESHHIIQSFLAHHQAMSLVALNNVLHNGVMQERFHADPWVRATDLILQEKFPEALPLLVPRASENNSAPSQFIDESVSRSEYLTSPSTNDPRTRLLSNGRFTVMVDNAGNGFTRVDQDMALTRWREDSIAGQFGTYIYVRDLDDGKVWSVAYQPTCVEPEAYEVFFNPDKVEFKRRDFGIGLHTEITVSPEDNVEVRRVMMTNLTNRKRRIELISYAEVALSQMHADAAHPAFAKMFIESEYIPDFDGLIFSRRPRSKHEEVHFMMHIVTMKSVWSPTEYESSRAAFLGRGNTVSSPAILDAPRKPGTVGAVLDPILSLRVQIEIDEGKTETAVFTTGYAKSRTEILQLANRYHDLHSISRAFEMAWSHSNVELRHEQFTIRQSHAFQRLATALVYNISSARGSSEALANNRLTQSGFWRFGVSGDLPIVLLRVNDAEQIRIVKELLLAHQYLRMRGLSFDLVILDEYPGDYFQAFHEEIEFLVRASYSSSLVDRKGGVYLRSKVQLSHEEITLLEATARVLLSGAKRSLASQMRLDDREIAPTRHMLLAADRRNQSPKTTLPAVKYEFPNGFGGFVANGAGYQIEVRGRTLPPMPWSNVIANPNFGFLSTESGGGYTWSENSRENRLTPWSNDPVSDRAGEVIYLRDMDSGQFWSPTPRPIAGQGACRVRHGFGESEFLSNEQGIGCVMTISGSTTESVKWWNLKLKNNSGSERRLEVFLYLEWTLGVLRSDSVRTLVSNFDKAGSFLYAMNHYNNEFAGRVVYCGASLKISSFTTNRSEFIGRHHDSEFPRALGTPSALNLASIFNSTHEPIELSGQTGAGFDSCGVLKVDLALAPGQERELHFYLGEAGSLEDARRDSTKFKSPKVRSAAHEGVRKEWESTLSTIVVHTPDRSFDILINGWLLYQTLSCRVYGRSAFYQSGGAIGFRDQLQDVMALLYAKPELARAQIILHAAHQFPEGDVQHWWHPPTGRGVRTKISDDYLWLTFVVHRYIEVTGDLSVLDEQAGFVVGPLLEAHQMESYLMPQLAPTTASIYEHCILALNRSLEFGEHGLPLMGGGDWNDGMNEVGKDGKGESVWLAWFLSSCLSKFSAIARKRSDDLNADKFVKVASQLVFAIEQHAWDESYGGGAWYRRAYFDDGTPLGSASSQECRIDSIAQSWSVICGGGDAHRRDQAMESVMRELVRPDDKIISLLTPPFDNGTAAPGYIAGYLPGVRENGGQYTHAAAWVVMATAMQGKGGEAHRLFSMLNPINHSSTNADALRYKTEPYVMCGDVYSTPPHTGRGGWSWYTGSSGWMYQVGIEQMIGLTVRGDYFAVDPCVPATWREFSFEYRRRGVGAKEVVYQVEVKNPDAVEKGVVSIEVDGVRVADKRIHFGGDSIRTDGVVVRVSVVMGNG